MELTDSPHTEIMLLEIALIRELKGDSSIAELQDFSKNLFWDFAIMACSKNIEFVQAFIYNLRPQIPPGIIQSVWLFI